MAGSNALVAMQERIWAARIPLEIRIASSESRAFDQADPYLIACSRLAYLPTLLPKLLAFFSSYLIADPDTIQPDAGHFQHDSIALKWHFPVGLLYDIHVLSTQQIMGDMVSKQPVPFRLTVHFAAPPTGSPPDSIPVSARALNDAFMNSVKEADFLRSGTAKPIMSLSAVDSTALWSSTRQNDLASFAKIHNSLLPSSSDFRNIPLRIFLPASNEDEPATARIRVLQGQFAPTSTPTTSTNPSQLRGPSGGQAQTVGTALNTLLPNLFPSRRAPILARPLLHGAQVPMSANLEDLARKCCYADGWVNIVVAMTT